MHLVGFTVRFYRDARSPELQIYQTQRGKMDMGNNYGKMYIYLSICSALNDVLTSSLYRVSWWGLMHLVSSGLLKFDMTYHMHRNCYNFALLHINTST